LGAACKVCWVKGVCSNGYGRAAIRSFTKSFREFFSTDGKEHMRFMDLKIDLPFNDGAGT